jgi:hypothetical protein
MRNVGARPVISASRACARECELSRSMTWARYAYSASWFPARRSTSARRSNRPTAFESVGACGFETAVSEVATGEFTGGGGAADPGGIDFPTHPNTAAPPSSARTRSPIADGKILNTLSARMGTFLQSARNPRASSQNGAENAYGDGLGQPRVGTGRRLQPGEGARMASTISRSCASLRIPWATPSGATSIWPASIGISRSSSRKYPQPEST